MFQHAELIIVVVGIALVLKWDRDKRIAAKKYHEAFLEGAAQGFMEAKESWRLILEAKATRGLERLAEEYPVLTRVVENKPAAGETPITGGTLRANEVGAVELLLPRLAFTIIVEPKVWLSTRYGELKATWEKMV